MLTSTLVYLALAAAGLCAGEARAEWNKIGVDVHAHMDNTARPLQDDGRRGRDRPAPKVRISLDQAVNMVERRSDGKVIGARTERKGNRVTHRVKVLDRGKVRTYSVDAMSGAIR